MNNLFKYNLRTENQGIHDITESLKESVEKSGIKEGICIVYNMHSTAGLTVFSPWDPNGFKDLNHEIRRLIPTRIDFYHQHDTPEDAAGHIKSALFGVSKTFIINKGKLIIGGSQHVYFLEFDGPRNREYYIKIIEG